MEKSRATCLERYGSESYLTSDEGRARLKQTSMERYGVANPSSSAIVRDRVRQTMTSRYGVDNPSKIDAVKDKIQANRNPYRSYDYALPSGKTIRLQGYENHGIELLLQEFNEDEIVFGKAVPRFRYVMDGDRMYYPDFFIPKMNLIVEVKSTWTMKAQHQRNLLKEEAVLSNGFLFRFMVFDATGSLVNPAR